MRRKMNGAIYHTCPVAHPNSVDELSQTRLDYAWKWFDLHARQRQTMLHFFLIASGVLVAGYAGLVKEGLGLAARALCLVGTVTSIGFILLDIRNRELMKWSEDALTDLEKEVLFRDVGPINGHQVGIRLRDITADELMGRFHWTRLTKHKVVIRGLEFLIGVTFLALGCYPVPAQQRPGPQLVVGGTSYPVVTSTSDKRVPSGLEVRLRALEREVRAQHERAPSSPSIPSGGAR